MGFNRHPYFWAIIISLAVHLMLISIVLLVRGAVIPSKIDTSREQVVFLIAAPPPPDAYRPEIVPKPISSTTSESVVLSNNVLSPRVPASMAAPPAPSAEEWAIASKYTLKNSKRYRYNWGQQVRSMMGTAIEGPDQGVVRFRIEIAPDGTLKSLTTLWSTSEVAERLAREAIKSMPPLPPTPNGLPLIFEQTISFQPYADSGPPNYQDDCLPDPPVFRNRFAWDGKSDQTPKPPPRVESPDPQLMAECLKQLPPDSIESVDAHNQRQFDQWRSNKLER